MKKIIILFVILIKKWNRLKSLSMVHISQVSTHNMHSSSEDDDMESPFPNDLSLQQVGHM